MRELIPTFNQTITVLNRLKGADNTDKLDKWFKTTIDNCYFQFQIVGEDTKGLVTPGVRYTCRIPESNKYFEYKLWINNKNGFTLSIDDYIFLGKLKENNLASKDIIKIVNDYRPNVFKIKFIKTNNIGIKMLNHYHIEGV